MSERSDYKLGEILKPKGYIRGPFGSALKRGEMQESGIPVYEQMNAIYDSREFRYFIDEEKFQELKRFQVQTDDLIISCSGTVGKISIIREEDPKGIISQALLILRPDTRKVKLRYLYYFFNSREGFYRLTQASHGSVQVNIAARKIVEQIPISLPSLHEQEAISAVLSSLDDKIDLLHRQNKTLEALAQTLFRHWFIDGAEDDWEKVTLQDVCDIRRGSSPRPIQKYIENGTVPWIKIADATGSSSLEINETKEFIIEAGVSKSVEVFPGDLILSNSATAGLPFFVGLYGCIHDGWLLFRDFTVPKNFIYFLLHFATAELNQMADGTVQKNLNTTLLKEYPFNLPPTELLAAFDEQAELFIKKIKANNNQIHILEQLRDTLLPKLMSGEVRVRHQN